MHVFALIVNQGPRMVPIAKNLTALVAGDNCADCCGRIGRVAGNAGGCTAERTDIFQVGLQIRTFDVGLRRLFRWIQVSWTLANFRLPTWYI